MIVVNFFAFVLLSTILINESDSQLISANQSKNIFLDFLKIIRPSKVTSVDLRMIELATLSPDDRRSFNDTLNEILVPRVPDTPSHANVKNFIKNYLKKLDWIVDEDSFENNTPVGGKKFTNIIGTLNPIACHRLVLACHYDSKHFSDFEFLGATDSAVPCSMMLELIRKLDPLLKKNKSSNSDLTLQLIFFDGEEAFHRWSNLDSLYGSRHLASRLNSLASRSSHCPSNIGTELDRIKVLVLLDLLGESNPRFCSFFRSTQNMFNRLEKIEKNLNRLNQIQTKRLSGTNYFSHCSFSTPTIEDDHIPFQNLGVPVLHIISTPFPQNWHLEGDNGNNLHYPTIDNLLKIFTIFLVEELNL